MFFLVKKPPNTWSISSKNEQVLRLAALSPVPTKRMEKCLMTRFFPYTLVDGQTVSFRRRQEGRRRDGRIITGEPVSGL